VQKGKRHTFTNTLKWGQNTHSFEPIIYTRNEEKKGKRHTIWGQKTHTICDSLQANYTLFGGKRHTFETEIFQTQLEKVVTKGIENGGKDGKTHFFLHFGNDIIKIETITLYP